MQLTGKTGLNIVKAGLTEDNGIQTGEDTKFFGIFAGIVTFV